MSMGNLVFQCDVYFCEYFNSSKTSSLKANIYSSGRSCNQISIYMQKWHSSICYPFPKETKIFVIKDSRRDPMKLIEHIKHMNEKKKKENMKTKKRGEQRLQDFLFPRWAQALIRKKMRIEKKKKRSKRSVFVNCNNLSQGYHHDHQSSEKKPYFPGEK